MKTLILLTAAIMFAGCTDQKARQDAADANDQVAKLSTQVAQLTKANQDLTNRVNNNWNAFLFASDELRDLSSQVDTIGNRISKTRPAILAATSKLYGLVVTNYGSFAVKVDNVVPYLDGNKITLSVGNLTGASITSGAVSLTYGKAHPPIPSFEPPDPSLPTTDPAWVKLRKNTSDYSAQYETWQNSLRSVETQITQPLAPSSWNSFEIICAPSVPDELAYLKIVIDPDSITLATHN